MLQEKPWVIPERLAFEKASEVFSRTGGWVIGADTVVVHRGILLGKPKDEREAERMLTALSGSEHFVITGVCLKSECGVWTESEITRVQFETLSEALIKEYVRSGLPMDKAGAYGIQDGYPLVAKVDGDYDNVVGLPVARLREILKKSGFGGEIYGND
jgi:septum formation protein